mgnify:CR=1 FL=1
MKTKWDVASLKKFEKGLAELFEAGKINAPLHLSGGNERQLISIFKEVKEHDWVFATHRNHYHYLLKGGDEQKLIDEVLGLPTGICKGQGRSMHIYDKSINFYTSAIVAGTCAIACGVGHAIKQEFGQDQNSGRPHVWVFVGDGAEDSGHFVEAVRITTSKLLPVTFIIEDNDLSIDSTKKMRWHLYEPVNESCIVRYKYERLYPHVGVGKWISFDKPVEVV